MAKQRRRVSPPTTRKKATAKKRTSTRPKRGAAKKSARLSRGATAARRTGRKVVKPATVPQPAVQAPAPAPTPPPAPRKPGFYEAVAIYERGVQALQRHDYPGAADLFRAVIQRYPEERELLERAELYLRVCERETARMAPPPEATGDPVYAATVAFNSGDHAGAVNHLQRALSQDAENDHAHYIMAAALSLKGRSAEAIEHLERSIALNPENRSQARQDPDLDNIRRHERFQEVIEAPASRRRVARRG